MVTLVVAVLFAGNMRGVQLAVKQVRVLAVPFGVIADEFRLSGRSARRRGSDIGVCTRLALLVCMEKCRCRFYEHGWQERFHVFFRTTFAIAKVCGRLFVEGELIFLGFGKQGHDLRHFSAEVVVLAIKGSGLLSEFVEEEVGVEKHMQLLVLLFDFG